MFFSSLRPFRNVSIVVVVVAVVVASSHLFSSRTLIHIMMYDGIRKIVRMVATTRTAAATASAGGISIRSMHVYIFYIIYVCFYTVY